MDDFLAAEAMDTYRALLLDSQREWNAAIMSVAGIITDTPRQNYLFHCSQAITEIVNAFVFLTNAEQRYSAKILVRSLLETTFYAVAIQKEPSALLRKARKELKDWCKFLRDALPLASSAAQIKNAEENFIAFEQELLHLDSRLLATTEQNYSYSAKQAAQDAEMENRYAEYRLFSHFTHSALNATAKSLDAHTDARSESVVIWCLLVVMSHLEKSVNATAPTLEQLFLRLIALDSQ